MFLAKKPKTNKNEGRKNHLYQWQLLHPYQNIIFKQIEAIEPEIVIIDSIQTLHTDYIESSREYLNSETTAELIKFAKETNIPVIIGHITKDGNIAGQNIGTYGWRFTVWRRQKSRVPHFAFP
jgi:predicted ATP-dependent serine protease